MSTSVSEVGRIAVGGTTAENTATVTPISINSSTTIVFPAKMTAVTAAPTLPNRPILLDGTLECSLVMEGTSNAKYTTNGVTPTSTIGQLLAPANGAAVLVIRGRDT